MAAKIPTLVAELFTALIAVTACAVMALKAVTATTTLATEVAKAALP